MPSRRELANAIRALSMDAVQQAKSGHPGAPMGHGPKPSFFCPVADTPASSQVRWVTNPRKAGCATTLIN